MAAFSGYTCVGCKRRFGEFSTEKQAPAGKGVCPKCGFNDYDPDVEAKVAALKAEMLAELDNERVQGMVAGTMLGS